MTKLVIESENYYNFSPLLTGAITNETRIIESGIAKTGRILKEFEKKYKIKSEQFYKRYELGEMGDSFDYIKWAGEYETLAKLQENN